jgi:Glycosyl transferase family 2
LTSTAATLREAIETAARNAVDDVPRRATAVLPRRVPLPPPPWAQVFEAPSGVDLLRRGLKTVLLSQRRLERRLELLENGTETPPDAITTFGPYARRSPRVSIVVTLYNYEQFVGEALTSVALSDYEDLEVVVIDDRSTDGSLDAARDALLRLPWMPAKLVSRGANRGLPAARNLGLAEARGELVFTLDADNALYPHAVGRLVEALDDDPGATFAYGILETFDVRGPVGLLSWGEWDPARLRHGNYIDAMALLRRSALEAVGGYPTDPRLYGWEDFALWCGLAERGLHGAHVPEIVGRYRTGPRSMIGLTNVDTADAWSLLLEQHAFLREAGG